MDSIYHMFPICSHWCQDSNTEKTDGTGETVEIKDFLLSLKNTNSPLILCGAQKGGKTSLLFQAAVSYATKDQCVDYICPMPLSRVPLGIHGMPKASANVLNSVKFVYLKTSEELLSHCASIHTKSALPDVVIVDDLNHYLSQESKGEQGTAKLFAFLTDMISFIKSKSGEQCPLLMGCQDSIPHLPEIAHKFHITPVFIKGHNEGTYSLKMKTQESECSIDYSIESSGLFFKNIELCKTKSSNTSVN